MSDEAGFLKALADQPIERATRLAYADWLDEQGRATEAEFLKVQIQAAELNARLIELGGQLGAEWLTTVGSVRVEPQWFKLRSGRSVRLTALRQWNFYAGLLAGVPTNEENREAVQQLIAEEQRRRGSPYLIEPFERSVDRPKQSGRGPHGLLPSIVCVGEFNSFKPAKDETQDGSNLTIIWFQDELALPIDPGVRERILAVDWDQYAHGFIW